MRSFEDLYEHQKAGVNLLLENSHFGLFLDMGLGKTATTLTAVNTLIYEDLAVNKVLIVAPKRVVESVWRQEAQEWAHLKHLRFSLIAGNAKQRAAALKVESDVYLVSRDNISWLCGLFGGSALPFDMLVIDESSSFKNHASGRFKALRLVQPSFSRVVILTGTPSPNGMIDLWPQIYLLDRGARLGKTITAYREAFFYAAAQNGAIVYKYGCSEPQRERITGLISDVVISMKQEDYISLPEFIENIVKIQMPPEVAQAYKSFEREKVLELFAEDGTQVTAANAAALNTKLLQYANGAVYDIDKQFHEVHDLKLDALSDIMEAAQGKPVLVAYTFKSDLARILRTFKKYSPRQLKTDQDIIDWNNGKIEMLLLHPASGGHGLNLQAGGHIIVWYGNTWDLELEQQLNRRLKRPGQKNNVIINKLVVTGTMDEDVIAAQKRKDALQSSLMEAVKYRVQQYLKNF
jgi:SNF2 family DNA or RNA helicase